MLPVLSPAYLLQHYLLPPALYLGYLLLEPDSPEPPWAALSFYTSAVLCCLAFFAIVFKPTPRGQTRWRHRLRRLAILVFGILLWQSLFAYYPYLYRQCAHRWKLWNWAFGEGRYACPPPNQHHITLKYALECLADFLADITQLLAVPFLLLYRRLFGGGWLNPIAWITWLTLYGTVSFLAYIYLGGSVLDLATAVVKFA